MAAAAAPSAQQQQVRCVLHVSTDLTVHIGLCLPCVPILPNLRLHLVELLCRLLAVIHLSIKLG